MRILTVGPSGIISMQRPMQWTLQHGHQLCLLDDHNNPQQEKLSNYRYIPFWAKKWAQRQRGSASALLAKLYHCLGVLQVRTVVKCWEPDVIHAHFWGFATDCCIQAQVHPLIISLWGALNKWQEYGVLTSAEQQRLATADALIVENPQLFAMCQALAKPEQRVELLPLGVNTQQFRPYRNELRLGWRRTFQIPSDTVVLLSPRGWASNYRHEEILNAYAQALPHFRTPTTLAFVNLGRSATHQEAEAYTQRVRQRAAALGVAEHIRWLPELRYAMMPYLYAMADVVINYPKVDAFPSTLLEATACERPVITAQLASYQHTFIEQFCTLADPHDSQTLVAAMIDTVNCAPQERANRLVQARQVMIEQYDETITQAQLMKLYEVMAQSHCSAKYPQAQGVYVATPGGTYP